MPQYSPERINDAFFFNLEYTSSSRSAMDRARSILTSSSIYEHVSVDDVGTSSNWKCYSPDDRPVPGPIDGRIRALNGSTFVLDLQRRNLEFSKQAKRPPTEVRMVELVRENGAYRHELHFFRSTFEAADALLRQVSDVEQEMILHYYLQPRRGGRRDEAWLTFSTKIEVAIEKYQNKVKKLEDEWTRFWSLRQQSAQCTEDGHPF